LIVVDASAMLEVLLGTKTGARVEDRLLAAGESLHAPHLIDVEVAQVLRRYAAAGEPSPTSLISPSTGTRTTSCSLESGSCGAT
jgi:predicted nucleic acid-binding protein